MIFGREIGLTPMGVDIGTSYAVPDDETRFLAADPRDRRWFVKAYPVDSGGSTATQYWSQGELVLDDPFKDRITRAIDFQSNIFGGVLSITGINIPSVGAMQVEITSAVP